jgi:uncharacterized protein YecE (DUF72 family)
MPIGLAIFLKCCRTNVDTALNFAIRAGTRRESLKMLAEQNISFCLSDHHDAPAPWKRTADFVYIRGHGPGGRYKGHYPEKTLTEWARRIRSWKKPANDVYVNFDNDQKSAAPADAQKLRQMLK